MTRFVLALDQGTTSSRAIVFDHAGAIVATAQQEFAQHFPRPAGWSTTPRRSGRRQAATSPRCWRAPRPCDDIAAIGITNQRETTVVWERATGQPVAPRSSGRTAAPRPSARDSRPTGHEPEITRRTGLLIDPYFSGTKLALAARHVPGARGGPSAASWPSAPSTPG